VLPIRYHIGMSKQIAVRLSDELVGFVDELVERGEARSRAVVVTRALEREQRRALAQRDAEILARSGPDPDLESLAAYAGNKPLGLA
jgi:Arc/MetJ-type ribon-helix-helix transcriptional regulator